MSLLLDALKRSEKARQEKAAKGDDGPAETREFSLESLEEEAREGHEPRDARSRVAETVEHPSVPPAKDPPREDRSRRAATEDTVEGYPDMEIIESDPVQTMHQGVAMSASRDERDEEGSGEQPTFSLLDEEPEGQRAVADTSGTLPSGRAVRSATDQYFDGTQSMSVSRLDVKRAIEGDEPEASGERPATGHTSTTQRRARTVVEARSAASRARGRSSAWIWMGVVLVFIAVAGGGGYYFYTEVLNTGPKLFAGGQPPPRTTPPPAPVQPVQTAAVVPPPAPAPAPEMPAPPVRGELAPGAEPVLTAEPVPSIEVPPPPVEEVLREPETPLVAPVPTSPEDISRRLARAIQDAGVPGETRAGIHVTKVTRRDTVSPQLTRAFDAFQSADSSTATQLWNDIVARDPDNRDALLGLAAAAVQAGQPRDAMNYYARVLRARPLDGVAQASLIALSDRLESGEAESRTKLLLHDDPKAAYLHFILGNVYAAESRWALAQESYFNAYSLDNSNPDYVFNLAVSLDHLAQAKAALGLYRRALQLAGNRSVGFETASVMNRIQVMTADATGQ